MLSPAIFEPAGVVRVVGAVAGPQHRRIGEIDGEDAIGVDGALGRPAQRDARRPTVGNARDGVEDQGCRIAASGHVNAAGIDGARLHGLLHFERQRLHALVDIGVGFDRRGDDLPARIRRSGSATARRRRRPPVRWPAPASAARAAPKPPRRPAC